MLFMYAKLRWNKTKAQFVSIMEWVNNETEDSFEIHF